MIRVEAAIFSHSPRPTSLPYLALHPYQPFFKKKKKILFIYFQREGKRGRRRGRETSACERYQLPLTCPPLGTWPTTQACALTGNQTGNLSVHKPALNPLSHTSQDHTSLSSFHKPTSLFHNCHISSRYLSIDYYFFHIHLKCHLFGGNFSESFSPRQDPVLCIFTTCFQGFILEHFPY